VFESIGRLAAGFKKFGMEPEDRIVLFMHNSLAHVSSWFAAESLGAVDAPINPQYSESILLHQISLVRPRFVICDRSIKQKLDAIRHQIPGGDKIIILINEQDDCATLLPSIDGLDLSMIIPPTPLDPRHNATILYTSGTTGPSKGVQMPHGQLYFYSEQTAALHRMERTDSYLAPYPLFHASARIHGIGSALVTGGECVLYDKFSATQFAERLAKSGSTITHFLGSMVKLIMNQAPSSFDGQSRLRAVMALPTPFSLMEEFCRRFGVESMTEVIGMTETSWPIMSPYGRLRPPGAAGLLVAEWFDAQVIDPETDIEVEPDTPGELVVRPKHPWIISSGYESMPERTVESRRNLWFHTGDMVRRDKDGWFYFVDRLKDSIRRRGENVSSFEVEEAILSFEGIKEAAVVSHKLPGEEQDEEILAFVIPDGKSSINFDALVAHLCERLPQFSVPRYYRIIEEFPKTPSGKIQKWELRKIGVQSETWAWQGR
jgi:crotonobetaine/carnitine-CoA ligase